MRRPERRSNRAPLVIHRVFEPDPEAEIQGLLTLLEGRGVGGLSTFNGKGASR